MTSVSFRKTELFDVITRSSRLGFMIARCCAIVDGEIKARDKIHEKAIAGPNLNNDRLRPLLVIAI